MPYKILFLDIDGTILKPDHTYTSSTKDAINQLQENGIEVFLATGRPIHEIAELADELRITSFIGYNGAHAIYQKESIIDEPMNPDTVAAFLQITAEHGQEIVFYTDEKNYFTALDTPEVNQFIETFQMKKNEYFTPDIMDKVLGATIINMKSEAIVHYDIDATIHLSQVNITGVEHCYDIIRKTVNKGEAIKRVLNRLDMPKERAIAFGDGMNDKEMLQAVGEGFAMGNANPDLLQYANRKTTSVEDSGIFNGLKELGLVN
ncbi:HAD family hydrolase [Lentibacillus sp. N15]|uniref:HAD family hydrolase n=1 Tax=Lentibacillus songyuanensis TaxID=3136161 RepID=UPI0031B9C007